MGVPGWRHACDRAAPTVQARGRPRRRPREPRIGTSTRTAKQQVRSVNDRLPAAVRIVEVGPRDGLQNEPTPVPAAAKVAFVDALTDAGHSTIEVSAFVSPRWVPQM